MKRITAMILAVLMILSAAACAMGEENKIWGLGDTGEKVTWIQTRLKELEYLEKDPDGVFDEMTEEALKAFQRNNGLLQSGMADTVTMKLLETAEKKASEFRMNDCEYVYEEASYDMSAGNKIGRASCRERV